MSHVSIAGNATRDSELKFTGEGTPMLKFSVADNTGWGDKKHTVYYDCTLWGKQGERLEAYIKKGTSLTVWGELDRRDWESNGKSGVSLDVRVDNVKLQGGNHAAEKKEAGQDGFRQPAQEPQQPDFQDDDIPF